MNTKQLRQKILDLAIKGKLVPQDPNDEPACKLLERIREEKEQLIKEGKLKRDKNESYIFVGADKLHYEKFADGSVVCIEDEIPFEIPDSWMWTRLKNIGSTKIGLTYKPTDIDNIGIAVLRSNNIKDNKLNLEELIYANCLVNDNLLVMNNDILICARNGSKHLVGKSALIKNIKNKMTFGAFMSIYRSACNNYIFRFLNSNYFRTTLSNANSTQINQLTQDMLKETLCPLPPLNEQQRISETVETLLQLVDAIESDKTDLSNLIKQTKAKVLDLAIKGKLVPQDPNDEPADKLLEKIREEKEKLIKEGKLKRDKNETYIFKNSDDNSYYEQIDGEVVCIDDDLPFEIPDTWRWERLGNIGIARIGLTYKPKNVCREGIPVLRSNNINIDKLDLNDLIYVDCAVNNNLLIANNDIIICARNGSKNLVGKCALVTSLDYPMTYGAFMACYKSKINNYIFRFLNSTYFRTTMINANSTQINQLTQDMLKNTLCPIPPIKEQIKIVSKIKSIFTQLDRMQEIFLQ